MVFETLMMAGAMVMVVTLWLGWWRSARSADELRLTPSEREVALASLSGRAELSAFVLDDLILPEADRGETRMGSIVG